MGSDGNDSGTGDIFLDLPTEWFSPWNYPTKCSEDIALQIASALARGASFNTAVMSAGVSRNRALQWMKWGAEAYDRDADGNDRDAQYLNLFVKCNQAVGFAGVRLEQQARLESPGWWLTHNPEHRNDRGAVITNRNIESPISGSTIDSTESEHKADEPLQLPMPSPENIRDILKSMMSGGAAISPEDVERNQQTG